MARFIVTVKASSFYFYIITEHYRMYKPED